MAIRRNVSVLNSGIIADINIVQGSDLIPIEFYITDYVLPHNAIAILYCETSDKQLLKDVGTITNNVISFNPTNGFFTVGKNNLQIRITAEEKNLYTFEMGVNCKPKIANDDAQEVESQPTLVEQLLTEVGKVNGELENQKNDIKVVQDGENVPDFESYDDEESHETILSVSSIKKGDKLRDILSKITKFCNNIRYIIEALALEKMHEAGFFTVGDAIAELNDNMNNLFICGTARIVNSKTTGADVATVTVALPKELPNSNYKVLLTFNSANYVPDSYDANYDVEFFTNNKTTKTFNISMHRGTEGFLVAGGQWDVDYLVIP